MVMCIIIIINLNKKKRFTISQQTPSSKNGNSNKKCTICDFSPVNRANSTSRDAIFTMLTSFGPGSERLVRSLHTTGSKATIVIFTPDDVTLPDWIFDCNVRQVKSSPLTSRVKASPYKMRWEWYYEFLMTEKDSFDRILHTDAFDAFFFGDPFYYAPDFNALYFQMEDKKIRDCPYNKQWILACHYDVNRYQILANIIACSGSLLGGVKPFLQFVELLITHNEWPLCWGKGFDQGDFNYVLYNELPKTNITTYYMDCNSGFMTYNYCVDKKRMFNEKHQPISNDGTVVAFAHQYNRYSAVSKHIQSLCNV